MFIPQKNAIYRYCSIGNMKKSTMFEAVFRNTNVIFGEDVGKSWQNTKKTKPPEKENSSTAGKVDVSNTK